MLAGLPVELIMWPAESDRREILARAAVPRILLVAVDASPPHVIGVDEDWIRLPAADADVLARAMQLLRLEEHLRTDVPYLDGRRYLHRAGTTVLLTAAEASIMSLLLADIGAIVLHASLEDEVWHGPAPSHDALDAAIYRLRRRLAGLGMRIRSVRGRGFTLELDLRPMTSA